MFVTGMHKNTYFVSTLVNNNIVLFLLIILMYVREPTLRDLNYTLCHTETSIIKLFQCMCVGTIRANCVYGKLNNKMDFLFFFVFLRAGGSL